MCILISLLMNSNSYFYSLLFRNDRVNNFFFLWFYVYVRQIIEVSPFYTTLRLSKFGQKCQASKNRTVAILNVILLLLKTTGKSIK